MPFDLGYRLRVLVTENLNLKLLSLACALFLYSLVHGSQEAQRSLLLSVVAVRFFAARAPASGSSRGVSWRLCRWCCSSRS